MQQIMHTTDGWKPVEIEAQPPLPEFAFSEHGPRYLSRHALCAWCNEPIHEKKGERNHYFVDDEGPLCIVCADAYVPPMHGPIATWAHKVRAQNTPGKADPDWDTKIQGKPRFASIPLHRSNRAPIGTVKPFLPESFAIAQAEYDFLVSTQDLDLPTVGQELAQLNIPSFSVDRPVSDDGDLLPEIVAKDVQPEVSDEEIERAARRYGTAVDLPDPDLLRRIEWERFVSHCSAVTTIRTVATTTGRTIAVHDRRWTPEMVRDYAPHFVEAFGGQLAPQDELEGARRHIAHFRLRALDFAEPDAKASWAANNGAKHAFLNFADDNVAREKEVEPTPANDGPKELGFHDDRSPNEPSEFDLWPLSESERRYIERFGSLPGVEAYRARNDAQYYTPRAE